MTLPAKEIRPDRRWRDEPVPAGDAIVGNSAPIVQAIQLARKFADTGLPILLVGATGTGKELFAQRVHEWSGRGGPFVDVNCGALPKEMVESILFGHCRGAFTGATEQTDGLIAAAHGGTLFLDELSSLTLESQVKLLRVLETGEVRRIGETAKRRVRFRVVAAVQEDLDERVARGEFRLDLFQRVAGVVLRLPALRERPGDLWPLALHFAAAAELELGPECRPVVERYSWPANVRELKLAVERAGLLTDGGAVGARQMAEAIELGAPRVRVPPVPPPGEKERAALEALLARHPRNMMGAARELGVSRATLYRRMQAARVVRKPDLDGSL